MEPYLLIIFLFNIVLILLDATLGYHMAPYLARTGGGIGAGGVRTIRRFLTGIVTFYMFLNCLGYFRGSASLLVVVTLLVFIDFAGQLFMRRKWKGK